VFGRTLCNPFSISRRKRNYRTGGGRGSVATVDPTSSSSSSFSFSIYSSFHRLPISPRRQRPSRPANESDDNEEVNWVHPSRAGDARRPVRTEPLPNHHEPRSSFGAIVLVVVVVLVLDLFRGVTRSRAGLALSDALCLGARILMTRKRIFGLLSRCDNSRFLQRTQREEPKCDGGSRKQQHSAGHGYRGTVVPERHNFGGDSSG